MPPAQQERECIRFTIRKEEEKDRDEVNEVIRDSFWDHFQPGADEHYIAHSIRNSPDFVPELTLVAEIGGHIVGSIVYSRSLLKRSHSDVPPPLPGHEYGQAGAGSALPPAAEQEAAGPAQDAGSAASTSLTDIVTFGPLCVLHEHRRRGVAAQLMRRSFEIAAGMGLRAVFILGDLRYYGRHGFRCAERFDITNSEGFFHSALMALPLWPKALDGLAGARYHESSVFAAIDPEALAAFDATFPPREKHEGTETQAEFAVMVTMQYPANACQGSLSLPHYCQEQGLS